MARRGYRSADASGRPRLEGSASGDYLRQTAFILAGQFQMGSIARGIGGIVGAASFHARASFEIATIVMVQHRSSSWSGPTLKLGIAKLQVGNSKPG
jgi:hypothetical protein